MNYEKLPHKIQNRLKKENGVADFTGMSNANIILYKNLVLKSEANSSFINHEYVMLMWLRNKLPVPQVIEYIKEDEISYILMERLKGNIACTNNFLTQPEKLIKVLASFLKKMWKIPLDNCPYNLLLKNKLAVIEQNFAQGICNFEKLDLSMYSNLTFKSLKDLLKWLRENAPVEDLVFSHGDFCLPNLLIDDDEVSGLIDLGRSGVSDRYQDIALCYRSLKYNFAGIYSGVSYPNLNLDLLFDELGIVPDYNKLKYYILLDELY